MKKLTRDQKREIAAIAARKDADIDLSEMPEVVDWSGAEVGKFYRPAKRPVTMRLDADVIAWLKSYGPGYQTKANLLLRHAMQSTAPKKASPKRRRAQPPVRRAVHNRRTHSSRRSANGQPEDVPMKCDPLGQCPGKPGLPQPKPFSHDVCSCNPRPQG